GEGVALADTEVVDGPDVEPAQLEDQVHLGRPAADAAHRHERGDQLLVAAPGRPRQGDGAIENLGREVAQRGQLVRRQSRSSQRRVGCGAQRVRGQRPADCVPDPTVDRLGRPSRELLEDDRADQRAERPVRVARRVADRPHSSDERREHGIAGGNLVDRRPQRRTSHCQSSGARRAGSRSARSPRMGTPSATSSSRCGPPRQPGRAKVSVMPAAPLLGSWTTTIDDSASLPLARGPAATRRLFSRTEQRRSRRGSSRLQHLGATDLLDQANHTQYTTQYDRDGRPAVSVPHALLALLSEGPKYGLRLQNEFEARTGEVWPLNVGQVYTTLQRLERDGLVESDDGEGERSRKRYRITSAGGRELGEWLRTPPELVPPPRDELVIKVLVALQVPGIDIHELLQVHRRHVVEVMQRYTRVKAAAGQDEV